MASSNIVFYCQTCQERNINSTIVDCNCFDIFEHESSRQCLHMDKGFFKIWLMDIYGDRIQLLMNFAYVRCIYGDQNQLFRNFASVRGSSNIISYIQRDVPVSYTHLTLPTKRIV